jgi:hypothetical protein
LKKGVGLQGFELLQAAMEGALDAGFVAGDAVEFGLEVVRGKQVAVFDAVTQLGFHAASAAKVPGGGDQFIEQGLLDGALRFDLGQEIGQELLEFFVLAGRDDHFAGAEAMLRSVLRGAGFAFIGSWSGGML